MAESNQIGIFPSELDSPSKKKEDSWGLRYAKAIISTSKWLGTNYGLGDQKDEWVENDKYAQGKQDIDKIRRRAIPTEQEYMTLPFNVGTPAPKLIRILEENIYSHPYKPKVDIFDSSSHSRIERKKNELLAKMSLSQEINSLKAQGIVPQDINIPQLDNALKDKHEIEMYQKTNAKVIEQIAIEKLIERSFANSNMVKQERAIVKDLVRRKHYALYCDTDEKGTFRAKRIDGLLLTTSYVENDDFSDLNYAGHISWITVGELRNRLPGLSDDQILDIIRKNLGKDLQKDYNINLTNKRYNNLTRDQRDVVESVRIEVFNFETLQSDRQTYMEKELNTGGYDIRKKSDEYEAPKDPGSKKTVHKKYIEHIYKGTYVMETEYMLDWYIKKNVFYTIKKDRVIQKPCFSYIIVAPDMLQMRNKSMVNEIIPNIDKMIILEMKMLHFLALALPPSLSYDTVLIVEAIKGMGMEGVKPKEIIEQMSWTGNLPYASRDEMGNQLLASGQKPVDVIPSRVDPAIERFATLWMAELDKVKEILGMNSAVDASSPDKKMGLGVQEMAANAYRTSIRSLQDAYLEGIKAVAQRAAYYQQLAIKEGTITDEMKDLLSDPEFAVLDSKKISELMFNVEIELLPTEQEKQQVLADVQVALQQGVIGMDDALLIRRSLKDSIEKAQEMLRYSIEQNQRKAAEAQQMQAQQQQQLAQQQTQAEAQRTMFEAESKMNLEKLTKGLEKENIITKEEEARKSMMVEYDLKKEILKETAKLEAAYSWNRNDNVSAPRAAGRIEPSVPSV